jgi:hypothetical protein
VAGARRGRPRPAQERRRDLSRPPALHEKAPEGIHNGAGAWPSRSPFTSPSIHASYRRFPIFTCTSLVSSGLAPMYSMITFHSTLVMA